MRRGKQEFFIFQTQISSPPVDVGCKKIKILTYSSNVIFNAICLCSTLDVATKSVNGPFRTITTRGCVAYFTVRVCH